MVAVAFVKADPHLAMKFLVKNRCIHSCQSHADLICSHKVALMSDDVQDVLQRTEWHFTERRRRRFIVMQTKEATQLQIRNLILPWLQVIFQK